MGGAAVAAPPTSVGHEVPSSFTGNRNIGGVEMFYFTPVVVVFAADALKRVTLLTIMSISYIYLRIRLTLYLIFLTQNRHSSHSNVLSVYNQSSTERISCLFI